MVLATPKVRVQKWRSRAAQLRTIADGLADEAARNQLIETARGYEAMAEHAERAERGEEEDKPLVH
jgi:hypothetical protein